MRKLITNCKYDLKFNYYALDNGTIYSERSNKILAPQLDKDGYEKVQMMSTDGKRHRYSIHRLIMENFCPREDMDKLQVNHIDGNKRNNKLSNLEWCTCSENIEHAYKTNLHSQKGERNNGSKLKENQVLEIIQNLLDHKLTQKQIGYKYGVSEDCIGDIKRHKNWKYLTKGINFD